MYKIRLINEFLHEPIWIYDQNKKIRLKYALISNDLVLQSLNEEVATLYDSFYKFDIDNEPCKFDNDEYRAAFPKIKELIEKIKERLNLINDGSFIVEYYITNQKVE